MGTICRAVLLKGNVSEGEAVLVQRVNLKYSCQTREKESECEMVSVTICSMMEKKLRIWGLFFFLELNSDNLSNISLYSCATMASVSVIILYWNTLSSHVEKCMIKSCKSHGVYTF